MKKTIKSIFDEHLAKLRFDQALATHIYRFQVAFVHKNEDHMDFFGGNLLGCHRVTFMMRDFNLFWETLGVDPEPIKRDISEIYFDNNKPLTDFEIASDIFNLTIHYLAHRFVGSKVLAKDKIERVLVDLGLIFNYRTIANFITKWFTYPVDEKTAQAVHANLSARYLIKRFNTWQEVFSYRASEMFGPKGLYREYIKNFDDDMSTVKMINDNFNRIKDLVKNIYSVLEVTNANNERIQTSSKMITDVEGEVVIKDQINHMAIYLGYMQTVVPERNSFIKNELISIITKVMFTMQVNGFIKSLEWISEHYTRKDHSDAESVVRLSLLESFKFLSELGDVSRATRDLSVMLKDLKGCYTSSRSTDKELMELRDITTKVIVKATGKSNEQTLAAIRTGVFLYICLRAYTKQHYRE